MTEPFESSAPNNRQAITAAQVDHLPIIASYARRLGLVGIVNRLVPVEMDVEPGIIVLGMVLDTLSGRSPLSHLESTFEACDRRALFGQEIPASYFSDDTVGRILEHLFNAGTQKIFSALSVSALQRFELSTRHVHFDTTSVNLYGDYLSASGVVVHSRGHDRRRHKRLERELDASLKATKVMEKTNVKKQFFCQADAEAAALDAMAQDTAYHQLKLSVVERPRYGPGRPKNNASRNLVAMEYGLQAQVIEKQHKIARRRKMAGCFVLLSNVAGEGQVSLNWI
jgi:hypothetical protein